MFTDSITGDLREVDIVAECTAATYPIFLSIECRDHKRPADVLWVEGMAKKHEHLPTSKLVLWSRSGFTKSALIKAKSLKIEAISQADVLSTDWARLARELIGGQLIHVTPKFTSFIDVDSPNGEPRRLEQVESAAWYNNEGVQINSMPELVNSIANSSEARKAVLDNAKIGPGNFYAELTPPAESWFVDLPEVGRAKIRRIGVSIETFTEQVPVETVSALSDGKVFTLASTQLKAGKIEVLIQESPDGIASLQSKLLPEKN